MSAVPGPSSASVSRSKRQKRDDRPPPDLRQQVCSSCELAWPWIIFGRQMDGSRDLDEHICIRCLGQEEAKWTLNLQQIHEQIARAKRKYLQELEKTSTSAVPGLETAPGTGTANEAIQTPPTPALVTPRLADSVVAGPSRRSPEKEKGKEKEDGQGRVSAPTSGMGQVQRESSGGCSGESGSTARLVQAQQVAGGSTGRTALAPAQAQAQAQTHAQAQAQPGPSNHATTSTYYGPSNPTAQTYNRPAPNPNPTYPSYPSSSHTGALRAPPHSTAPVYTHPDVRYHTIPTQLQQVQQLQQQRQQLQQQRQKQQQQQQRQQQQPQQQPKRVDQYQHVINAQNHIQRNQNFTSDPLSLMYNLPEPTRAMTWLQMHYIILNGAPPIRQMDLNNHYRTLGPLVRGSQYPNLLGGREFIMTISKHYSHMGVSLDRETFTISGLWRRPDPVARVV